jgi:hypothetical protein
MPPRAIAELLSCIGAGPGGLDLTSVSIIGLKADIDILLNYIIDP